MVSTAPTCANCGATILGHPIMVRVVDEGGAAEQPVCSLDCASALTDPDGGAQE
jgi:hypothetical protein